jgi:trimeric autotransporter adhesin
MIKKIILLIYFTGCFAVFAQDKMYIHKADDITLGVPLSAIGSFSLNSGKDTLFINSGSVVSKLSVSDIDSISFAEDSDTIQIHFADNSISIINPLAFENVSVTATGTNVTINSTSAVKGINFKISGTTSNGSLKIYSSSKFNLLMDGVNITNSSGPAINIQSSKEATIFLIDGIANSLTDGTSYADTCLSGSGATENQNAAFYSKGALSFRSTGSLTIYGLGGDKHGIYSKDDVTIEDATVIVKSASKDGIHPKDILTVTSGTINISSTGDAIDAGSISITGGSITTTTSTEGSNGISSGSTADLSNAEINITVSGDQAKGLKSDGAMTLGSGNITINTSGGVVLETSGSGYDPSYCTAIKCDTLITISGATIKIKSTGKSGKGISSDGDIIINDGNIEITATGNGATYKDSSGVTDTYHSTCIGADGNMTILGGTVTTSSSGAAGRGITSDGTLTIGSTESSPTINITTTGSSVYISGSGDNAEYDEAKTISCDGAITINNGVVTVSSADDGIKSDTTITINGGSVTISKSYEGIEAKFITINSGTINVAASDDGINSTMGNGSEASDGSCIYINGGTIGISVTTGDGLDSNGNIAMTGGTVVINGPNSNPEVAFDYNGTFNISGGFLIASGPNSGNMIQATSTTSSQYTVKATTSQALSSSSLFNIQDGSGISLVTFKPTRSAYYFIFSSSDLKSGSTYNIYTGGSSTGTNNNGLYTGGSYSGGTLKKSFSISNKVTSVSF